jgi:hypothetical protein
MSATNRIIIQLLVLVAFAGIAQSIVRLMIGQTDLILLGSYEFYFLALQLPLLLVTFFLLRYYLQRKYYATFGTALLALAASLILSIGFYEIITTLKAPEWYLYAVIFAFIAQFLYSLSLIAIPTGKQPWLRIAGCFQIITLIPLAFGILLLFSASLSSTFLLFTKYQPWFMLFSAFTPLCFIPHFVNEAPPVQKEQTGYDWQVVVVLIILLVSGVTLRLISDGFKSIYWSKKNRISTMELSKSLEPRMFIGSRGDTLYYDIRKPLNHDTSKKYPLIINLSQGAQPGKSISKSQDMGGAAVASLFLTKPYQEQYPAYIFVPSCPVGSSWGGLPHLKTSDSLLYEAISSLDSMEKGIDSKRRYVTGISFGAYGTWTVIAKRPDLFAAAIPLCGAGNPALAHKMVNVAVWAFHGEKDINVPVSGSRDMIQAIKKAGGHPRYTEFARQGHNIWELTKETEGIWQWLFSQRQK